MRMTPLLLRAARWLAFALLLLTLAAIRVHCSAAGELAAARRAAAAGDTDEALTRYGRAVRWRLPGPLAGPSDRAAAAMRDLARGAADHDPSLTERAQRELRGALLGARWLTPPHADWLAEANRALASTLAARDAVRARAGASSDGTGSTQAARERALARIPGPAPLHATVAVLLFLCSLAASLALAVEVGRDAPARRRCALFGAAVAVTLLGWQVALATLDAPLTLAAPAAIATAVALAVVATGLSLTTRPRPLHRLLGAGLTCAGTLATLACAVAALRPGFF
ncbi:MAG: hypothetical protein IT370_05755 [Deltaproteobacteria bacterium]|nr:hypothetical protein [Deltaproteobacteria bacterium]